MKNITIFNSLAYKKFLNFLYRKVKVLSFAFAFILVICGTILMYFNCSGYLYVIFGILLPIFVYSFLKIIEVDNIKNNKLLKYDTVQNYIFDDEFFSLSQTSIMGEFNDNYYYDEFLKVVKTKEYYYFFVNRAQALIVDISGFNDNDDLKLDEILNKSIKEKFINKNKKNK